jgi:phosphohistidine phosphatase SixA
MQAPGITRHRRPFLAPLWVGLLGVVLLATIGWAVYRSSPTTVVFLVRPAEKDPAAINDPPLSPEGEARALRLAQMFGDSGAEGRIDAIYESDDRRAEQTAAPLVERLHHAPVVFASADARAVAARALREHSGGTMMMVARDAVLPQMIRELTGVAAPPAAAAEADVIYLVSVPRFGRAHLVRLRF